MKFNYKKIASVFAGAIMLSSTIGFAAAANYPAPFTSGAAVVYGAAGASSDMSAALDIYDQLKDRVGGSTGLDASVSGEAKPIETSSQPLYLGDYMNTTKQTFSKDQLPTVLASGTVTDDDGKELDYDLKVDTINTTIIYGETPDNDDDTIYANLNNAKYIYKMKIIFPTAVNATKLTDEAITLFGKEYTFSGSTSDLTNESVKLFEKATAITVNDGEEVTAEGHTISVAVEDTDTASVTIDGVTESHDEGWSGKIGGVDVYFKNVMGPAVAGVSRFIEIYLNSDKITLAHGNEVTLGSDDVAGTIVYMTSSAGKVSGIDIMVSPYDFDDQIKYLTLGESFSDPVFGSLKFELSSLTPDLDASTRDEITIKPSSENAAGIAFVNKAGKAYDMDMMRPSNIALNESRIVNGTVGSLEISGTHTYNATELGVGDDYKLITTASEAVYENDYFITCSNEYTQIWRLSNVKNSTANEVKVKDQGAGSDSVTITLSSAAIGASASLPLGDGSTTTIYMVNNSAINVTDACAYLYTKNGAKIDLQYADAPVGNFSEIIIEEETSYNGGAFTDHNSATVGNNVSVRLDWNEVDQTGKDMKIRDVMGAHSGALLTDFWSDDVGDYDYHYVTKYGTLVKRTGDSDKTVKIWYPEDAMSVGFYIGEVSSEITPGTTGTAGGGQIELKKDTEVDAVKDKHLIVIGGSCVNTVAAKILDSTSPLCGADFTAKTQVSDGGYIIQTVASPYNEDKVAMLVAGYEAADTISAVKAAMVIDGVNTAVGEVQRYPITATTA